MITRNKQVGFTIIELMIATTVFTTILMVVMGAITQIGRMYYKGITTSKTQESVRQIVDRISQEVQYSGVNDDPTQHQINGSSHIRCVGKTRYFYVVNQQNVSGNYGIWSDSSAAGSNLCSDSGAFNASGNPTTLPGAINPRDLLPENMRVLKFEITNPAPKLYTVTLRVAYGDTDLLDTSNGVDVATCTGSSIGTQFCAVSELSATVGKRL